MGTETGTSGVPGTDDLFGPKATTWTASSHAVTKVPTETGAVYSRNETLGADAKLACSGRSSEVSGGQRRREGLNKQLLRRAASLLDSCHGDDPLEVQLNIESLRGILLELWEGAASKSQFHQDILALIEGAVLSVDSITPSQALVLREGLLDLEGPVLVAIHVDAISARLVQEGFSPLAMLGGLDDGDSHTNRASQESEE